MLSELMHKCSAHQGQYASILDGYFVSPEQIERDQIFIAANGPAILGFYSLVISGSEAELDLMFVADDAQGMGVGAALFRHMRQTANAVGITRVTIISHPPAERFYLRMGAKRIGLQPSSGRAAWPRPHLVLGLGPQPDTQSDPTPS